MVAAIASVAEPTSAQAGVQEKDLEMGMVGPAGAQDAEGAGPKEEARAEHAEERQDDGKAWKTDAQVIPKNNLWLVFAGLILATFLAALDQTIVSAALPTISRDLGGSSSAYSWVGTSYLLMATCLSPFYGKVSNICGRKPVLFSGIIVFIAASALCGAAKNMTWLCICRGLQGVGGGAIMQLTQIIISDVVPLAVRGKYSGFVGMTWGVAAATGPLIGGLLTDHVSWRWCFFINLPTGAFALAILFFSLKLNPHHGLTLHEFVSTFDFLGLFLIIAGVVLLLVGFSSGETNWASAETIALLVVGVVTLVGAGYVETTTKRSAIIPPRLFKTRTTAIILIVVFFQAFGFISLSYYGPVYFQILGSSATISGLQLMPFSVGTSLVSIGSGFLIAKFKRCKEILIVSFAVSALGYGLTASLDERSSRAKQEIYLLVAALGIGCIFQAPYIALQASMPQKDMATSTSTIGLLRSLGGTVGISVGGAIYASELKNRLAGTGYVLEEGSVIAGNVAGLSKIEPLELRQQVLHAYTRSLNTIWIVAAPLLLVGAIMCIFMKHYSLDRNVVLLGKDERQAGADSEQTKLDEAVSAKKEEAIELK